MKKIEGFILKSCGYTVLLLIILYIFLTAMSLTDSGVPVGRFLLMLGYGCLISAAELVYKALEIRKALKVLIHYSMLLAGFMVVYLTIRGVTGNIAASILVAIAIFTLLYALILGAVIGIKRLVGKADSELERRPDRPKKKKETPEYHSLYGDN